MSEPDVGIGFIYGWRIFDVTTDGHLQSPYKASFWPVGSPKPAACHKGPWGERRTSNAPHTIVPDIHCTCGYYCYNSLSYLKQLDWISEYVRDSTGVALCRGWGGVVLHNDGFRSQYLAIDELWMDANAHTRSLTRNLYLSFRVRNREDFEARKPDLLKKTSPRSLKDVIWIPRAEADLADFDGPRSNRAEKLRANKKRKQQAKRKNLNPGSSQRNPNIPKRDRPKKEWW